MAFGIGVLIVLLGVYVNKSNSNFTAMSFLILFYVGCVFQLLNYAVYRVEYTQGAFMIKYYIRPFKKRSMQLNPSSIQVVYERRQVSVTGSALFLSFKIGRAHV